MRTRTELYVDVCAMSHQGSARAVLAGGHTIILLEKNGQTIFSKKRTEGQKAVQPYKRKLAKLTIYAIEVAETMDGDDSQYIKQGVEMNLRVAEAGRKIKKVGYYLTDLVKKGYLHDDVFTSSKILVASASDARMAGMSLPVMSSGGSGNQGIVAILVPYNVGKHANVSERKILRSIALSHLVNSYINVLPGRICHRFAGAPSPPASARRWPLCTSARGATWPRSPLRSTI